jgi:NADH dehydrogenase FAD-containing subunit
LLHFAVVGGGPTGIEFSAELHDLILDDLSKFYPDLVPLAKITVYDVSKRILGSFDAKLAAYAAEKFARDGIEIATESRIVSVGEDHLDLAGRGREDVGMTVWATGLAAAPLTGLLGKTSGLMLDQRGFRLLTDPALRVKLASGKTLDNVYAIGDCATIQDYDTPCTAQVAYQKARHLATVILNKPAAKPEPFAWKNRGMLSYVGGWKAVADLGPGSFSGSGRVSWLLWRSAYFVMTVSVRNKILIPMYWLLTWLFGRDITKI